jgi:hypothetical protein
VNLNLLSDEREHELRSAIYDALKEADTEEGIRYTWYGYVKLEDVAELVGYTLPPRQA